MAIEWESPRSAMTVSVRPPDPPSSASSTDVLTAYVPRLVIEWLRDEPDALHRELDATLVFVDISGFTALTERLARRGKIGAELMRDTLDGVFTGAARRGLRLGRGAAQVGRRRAAPPVRRPGPRAAGRRAAWEMQRHDRPRRPAPRLGRDASRCGCRSASRPGAFDFFMAGSVHRELLIAGPAMTETVHDRGDRRRRRDRHQPGARRAASTRRCIGPTKEDGASCSARRRTSSATARQTSATSAALDIASCIPVAARDHVLLEQERARAPDDHRRLHRPDGHRRAARASSGPRRSGEALDERIRAIQEAALRYEVPFYETDVGKSQRQGAADRRRAVEHRPRRGADAAHAARDHGAGRASCRCGSASTPARSSPATSGRRTAAPTASSATRSTRRRGS